MTSPGNVVWLLDLAKLELISALHRRLRNRELDETALEAAMEGLGEEFGRFHVEPMTHAIVGEAEGLLRSYGRSVGLRTFDALHLACFTLICEVGWCFVSADKTLCEAVTQMGFKALNPLKAGNANQ